MSLLYFILACYGITLIITQSAIFKPVRDFFMYPVPTIYKLLNCVMCTGFWVGLLLSLSLRYSPTQLMIGTDNNALASLVDGAFTSGCLWLMYMFQLNLEKDVKDEL